MFATLFYAIFIEKRDLLTSFEKKNKTNYTSSKGLKREAPAVSGCSLPARLCLETVTSEWNSGVEIRSQDFKNTNHGQILIIFGLLNILKILYRAYSSMLYVMSKKYIPSFLF